MKLQNPSTDETITVRRKSETAAFYLAKGWKDVTEPRTPLQMAAFKKFSTLGDISRIAPVLNNIAHDSYHNWTDRECAILLNAVSILKDRFTKIQTGSK